jgi:hypothetical protein
MKKLNLFAAVIAVCVAVPALAQDAAPAAAPAAPAMEPGAQASDLSGLDRVAKNGVFLELAGEGGFYSLNYERFLLNDVAARVGVMYMGISASAGTDSASVSWLAVPIMAEYTGLRSGSHALELAAGVTIHHISGSASTFDAFSSGSGTLVAISPAVGYRYQNPAGGMIFRATFSPLFFPSASTGSFLPWFGISVGYGF